MDSSLRLGGQSNPTAERELRVLAAERDPELYFDGLNRLARRLADRHQLAEAGEIWSYVVQSSADSAPESARKAQRELEILNGGGCFGDRAEFLSRRFLGEAMQPSALFGMALGGGAYSLSRSLISSRLLLSQAGALTRGLGARAVAGLGGFALEAPVFTLATRGLRSVLGEPSGSISHELASSYLSLGGLRLLGASGGMLARRTGFHPAIQGSIAKSSAYLGVLAGQGLERSFGLRPAASLEGALFDGIGTLFQAQVGARLLGAALGPRWSAWQNEIQVRGESTILLPKLGNVASSNVKVRSGLASTAAAYGALFCTGCSGNSVENLPWLLGLGGIAALGLRSYLRSVKQMKGADAFHALPKKTLADLLELAPKATGLSSEEVDTVMTTVLRYGAPPVGMNVTKKRPFQKIARDLLRLPKVERRGFYMALYHSVLVPDDINQRFSSISGMPLAYADRIRAWARLNLEVPDHWLAQPEQIAARKDILINKIAHTFRLPLEQASQLVELILREPLGNPVEQKGQLYKDDFAVREDFTNDFKNYDFHLKLNLQPAHAILKQAGLQDRSITWLKQVISQLAAECRIPVPGFSMRPSWARPDRGKPATEEFYDHDWQAVYRLRDAFWGPWRLPWEDIP